MWSINKNSLVWGQLSNTINYSYLMPRDRLEKIANLISLKIYRKNPNLSDEALQAWCFAKVVDARGCWSEAFAIDLVALKSLQGESVYETLFANLNDIDFQKFLSVMENNKYYLIENDPVYKKHRGRLAIIESILGITHSSFKAKFVHYYKLLGNPQAKVLLATWGG